MGCCIIPPLHSGQQEQIKGVPAEEDDDIEQEDGEDEQERQIAGNAYLVDRITGFAGQRTTTLIRPRARAVTITITITATRTIPRTATITNTITNTIANTIPIPLTLPRTYQ